MNAPKFYKEQGIPKVRWMYPGKAYKARLVTVPRTMHQAKMYVYILNERFLIAFKDEELTLEIGMLPIKHFEKFGYLEIEGPPTFTAVCPTSITYGQLLDIPIKEDLVKENETFDEEVRIKEKKKESMIRVRVLPPDPPTKQKQMSIFDIEGWM